MNGIEKLNSFLDEAHVFYLATVGNNLPHVRPLGLHMLINGKLYFGVGDFKDVYKQMQNNPNCEISTTVDKKFVRYYGKAIFEADNTIANIALEKAPHLKTIYNDETGHKMMIFHLEDSTIEFRAISGAIEESYKA